MLQLAVFRHDFPVAFLDVDFLRMRGAVEHHLRGHFINFEGHWGGLRGGIFEG